LHYAIVSQDHRDHFDLSGESSVGNSDASYELAKVKYEHHFSIIEDVSGQFRLTAGAATNGVPYERKFWLDRANNYEEQSDGFFRAMSQLSPTIGHKASMFAEGGAGVRGYNANAPSADSVLSGTAMLGGSFDVSIPNPFASLGSFASSFAPGIFVDAGWVGAGVRNLSRDIQAGLRTDAGIAVDVNILSWLPGQLRGVANEYATVPEVNVYFPVFENQPLDGKSSFAFRWALSFGVAF
jgi:hypothetical protein